METYIIEKSEGEGNFAFYEARLECWEHFKRDRLSVVLRQLEDGYKDLIKKADQLRKDDRFFFHFEGVAGSPPSSWNCRRERR